MITIHELLEDPIYRKYFSTVPKLPAVPRLAPPWRLYLKNTEGRWLKLDCEQYAQAFKVFKANRDKAIDAAIVCRPMTLPPPTKVVRVKGKYVNGVQVTREVLWQPNLAGEDDAHSWCGRCRRPTVFKFFTQHHAFRGEQTQLMDPSVRRCVICGIRLEMVLGRR